MFSKQKSLHSEVIADKEVIQSLLRTISKLTGGTIMSRLIQGTNGKLLLVNRFEELSVQDAQQLKAELEADLQVVNQFLASEANQTATQGTAELPAAPAAEQPAQPQEQANGEQPAPADQPAAPAETQPSAGADQATTQSAAQGDQAGSATADTPATGADALNMQ